MSNGATAREPETHSAPTQEQQENMTYTEKSGTHSEREDADRGHGEDMMDETNLLTIDDEVIGKIARQAAGGIRGLHEIKGAPVLRKAANALTGKKSSGVGVLSGENQVIVDLNISVVYGHSIPEVMLEVSKAVKEAVEKMCGKEVLQVKVHTTDVVMTDASVAITEAGR